MSRDEVKAWVVKFVPQLDPLSVDGYLAPRNARAGDPVVGFRCPCIEGRARDVVYATKLEDLQNHLKSMGHAKCKCALCGRCVAVPEGCLSVEEGVGVGGCFRLFVFVFLLSRWLCSPPPPNPLP